MTLFPMKALGHHFSTVLFGVCLISAAETAHAGPSPSAPPKAATLASNGGKLVYPTFCAIPPAPTQLRSATAFRNAVLETRRAGRNLVRASGPETFGLAPDTAAPFAREARREAAPPPPMNPQDVLESEAFAREARQRAVPPKNPH